MFGDNVTKQLVAIENEQRAQKVSSPLNYGSLVTPSSTPTATWSGNVQNLIDFSSGLNARWIATFTRTDGINLPPQVMFPYDYMLARYFWDDLIAAGFVTSVSGRDKHAWDEYNFYDSLYEVGSNYVKWKIEVDNQWQYNASDGTTVNLTVQAVSMVAGNISLVRVI